MTQPVFLRSTISIFSLLLAAMNAWCAEPASQPATEPSGDFGFEIKVPPTARRSTGLKWSYTFTANSFSPDAGWGDSRVDTVVSGIQLDWNCGIGPTHTGLTTNLGGGGGSEWTEDLDDPQYDSLKPGPQTLHYKCVVSVRDKKHDPAVPDPRPPMCDRTFEGTVNWTLLPEDASTPLIRNQWDHSLQLPIEQAMEIRCLRDPAELTHVQVRIRIAHPPVGLGFNVYRTLDHFIEDIWMMPVAWRPGDHADNTYIADTYCELNEKTLTILFNPSPVAAAKLSQQVPFHLSGLHQIWNGKVVKTVSLEISPTRLSTMPQKESQEIRAAAMAYLLNQSTVAKQMQQDADLSKVRVTLQKTLDQSPTDREALLEMGFIAEASEDWAAASPYFQLIHTSLDSPQIKPADHELQQLTALFSEGAEQGDPQCQYCLGLAERSGYAVKMDVEHSWRLMRDAANGGYAPAMCELAKLYQMDLDEKTIQPAAREWYRAQVEKWYQRAASTGYKPAQKWVEGHQ